MEFETHIESLDYLMKVNYLFIPQRIGKPLFGHRLICTLNNSLSFHCGLVSLNNGDYYITINKARLKELGLELGDQVKVKLKEDKSEFGMEICPELDEFLKVEPEALNKLREMKPPIARQVIYHISSAKSEKSRYTRLEKLFALILNTETEDISFKLLFGKKEEN